MKIAREPARLVLATIPITGLLLGAASQFIRPDQVQGYVFLAMCGLVQSFLIFLWYRLDAQKRGFRRGRLLNTGIAGFTTLALPYYLFRSRGFLRGLWAIALALLLALGTLILAVVSATGTYLALHPATEPANAAITPHNR